MNAYNRINRSFCLSVKLKSSTEVINQSSIINFQLTKGDTTNLLIHKNDVPNVVHMVVYKFFHNVPINHLHIWEGNNNNDG
jgi:hypothetical protein